MNYFFLYQTLKAHFSSGAATHTPDDGAFGYHTHAFHSNSSISINQGSLSSPFDTEIVTENLNQDFTYPVFHPNRGQQSDGCIILLHGLNERAWDKYLPWAYQLAAYTNKTVILFPIAYHMNRSPEDWCNPRLMRAFVNGRKNDLPNVKGLSVANVALSERLSNHPERFLLSGYQAAMDLLDLVNYIKSGNHALIKPSAQIDFFAYSIGAFLSQILFMAHGNDVLSRSKLFIFCGGSAFADWQGISKYIMDSRAFERLHAYYNSGEVHADRGTVKNILNETALGASFVDLLSIGNLRKKGAGYYSFLKDRVSAVVLKNDKVVIADTVKRALKGVNVEEWDFDYPYSHIMPFPLLSNKLVNQVNEAFDRLMLRATLLFTT